MGDAEALAGRGLRAALTRAARALAIFGGLALVGAMAVTVASVIRAGFGRPILGDTEIAEMLVGVAIACFMPWCQIRGAHVTIDVFTNGAPARVRGVLDTLAALLVALVVSVLAWRLIEGGFDAFERQRETMFLQIPFWWGYAAASVGMVLWAITALFGAAERLRTQRS